jgi:D-sedoheptulose 7-phosphate isomerase
MNYLADLVKQINAFEIKKVNKLIEILKIKQKQRKKFFICGNGGSAANANHISNDLMLGFTKNKIGFPLLSLSSNIAKISCIGNDVGYEKIFSNQLKVLGNKGDLLIILSGSGNSKNIINAVATAKAKGVHVVCLTGKDGGQLASLADVEIRAPKSDYADRAQEIHIKVIHSLIDFIERHQ